MRTRTLIVTAALCAALCSVSVWPASSPAQDPAAQLRQARSLRCTYQSTIGTWVRNGHRSIEEDKDNGSVTYDDINITKGTARIIANMGASDLTAWIDRQGTLWLVERTPVGYEFITTVYPMYAEGSKEFVVLESRHSFTGPIALAATSYGSCKVWQ